MIKGFGDFLKKMANDDSDLGEMLKRVTIPKTAEHIFADAKIAGRKAEAEHLAECVGNLLEKIEQTEKAAREKEEELQEKIKTLKKNISSLEDKSCNLQQKLSRAEQYVQQTLAKNERAKLASIVDILTTSNIDPATQIQQIGKILDLRPPESALGEKVVDMPKKEVTVNADISGAASGK